MSNLDFTTVHLKYINNICCYQNISHKNRFQNPVWRVGCGLSLIQAIFWHKYWISDWPRYSSNNPSSFSISFCLSITRKFPAACWYIRRRRLDIKPPLTWPGLSSASYHAIMCPTSVQLKLMSDCEYWEYSPSSSSYWYLQWPHNISLMTDHSPSSLEKKTSWAGPHLTGHSRGGLTDWLAGLVVLLSQLSNE